MKFTTEEEMLELGRAIGSSITRRDAIKMIDRLLETIREIRAEKANAKDERTVFNLKAAIEGIRETMSHE